MRTLTFLAVCLMAFTSCKRKSNGNQHIHESTETPSSVIESSKFEIGSYSRSAPDLYTRLFQEARESDDALNDECKRINKLMERLSDRSDAISTYLDLNAEYINATLDKISKMTDSSLAQSSRVLLDNYLTDYKLRENQLKMELETIEAQSHLIQDKYNTIKIRICNSMMSNYRNNEYPLGDEVKKELKLLYKEIAYTDPTLW